MTYEEAVMTMPRGYKNVKAYVDVLQLNNRIVAGMLTRGRESSGRKMTKARREFWMQVVAEKAVIIAVLTA